MAVSLADRKHINFDDVTCSSVYGMKIMGEICADEGMGEDCSAFYIAEKEHEQGWDATVDSGRPLEDKEVELIVKEAKETLQEEIKGK